MESEQTGGRNNPWTVLAMCRASLPGPVSSFYTTSCFYCFSCGLVVYQGETELGKGGPGSPDCHPVLRGMNSDGTALGAPDREARRAC